MQQWHSISFSAQDLSSIRFYELPIYDLRFENRHLTIENLSEGFALDLPEIEPAVVAHKTDDGVKLPVYELSVVADY